MSDYAVDPSALRETVASTLGAQAHKVEVALGEVILTVKPADYLAAMQSLRDAPGCKFEQLIDLLVWTCLAGVTVAGKVSASAWWCSCSPSA